MDAGRRTSAWLVRLLLAFLVGLLMGCGGDGEPAGGSDDGGDSDSDDLTPVAATTSYPLQPEGLAVGGDVQDRATDVVSGGLTQEQVDEMVRVCGGSIEVVADQDRPCNVLHRYLPPCGPRFPYCFRAFELAPEDQRVLGSRGWVEVVEEDPDGDECGADPESVCLRLEAPTAEVLQRVEADPPSSTAPPTTTPTTTTPTTTTRPTTTPSTTPATPAPSTTSPTSAPPTATGDDQAGTAQPAAPAGDA